MTAKPPAQYSDLLPTVLPYRKGDPVPPGYQIETVPARGILASGLVALGASYGYALASGAANSFANGETWLLLPVVGPWVAIGSRRNPCQIAKVEDVAAAEAEVKKCVKAIVGEAQRLTVIALDGAVQALGAALVVAGLAASETRLVRIRTHRREARWWGIGIAPLGSEGLVLGARAMF